MEKEKASFFFFPQVYFNSAGIREECSKHCVMEVVSDTSYYRGMMERIYTTASSV